MTLIRKSSSLEKAEVIKKLKNIYNTILKDSFKFFRYVYVLSGAMCTHMQVLTAPRRGPGMPWD